MQLPITPIDFEITSTEDVTITSRTAKSARVLVRWSGIPIGTLTISVTSGRVKALEVRNRAATELSRGMARELGRRALLACGMAEQTKFAEHWHAGAPNPTGPTPTLSVAVCTRDRPDDLRVCLESLANLSHPADEVLVIDNAPASASTERLVKENFPRFRYIKELQPGLDHARNRAIREATGEVIAFTDDDVMVDPEWTGAVVKAFAAEPDLALLTGLIEPAEQETPAQVWFERYGGFGRGCIRHYFQLKAGATMSWNMIGAGQLGAGANMAMRRSVFNQVGLFDPALDVGTPTRGGGDHEIFFRLLRSGMICLYEPTAVVRHRHRRTMKELDGLLYNYGYATRCFFEREQLNFPSDTSSIKRLSRWWWKHWAWERLTSACSCPDRFPPSLVTREIRGFIDGRDGYRRSRRTIVTDESTRPDRFSVSGDGGMKLRKLGFAMVDLEHPLERLAEGEECEELDVMVRWRGRVLGRFRIPTMGTAVTTGRLADTIAGVLGSTILSPGSLAPELAWADFQADLSKILKLDKVPEEQDLKLSVSIIVATCNRPGSLRECLTSLASLKYRGNTEIIVVDNRPSADSAARIVKQFPGVRLITEERPGSSYARNAGVTAARGEIIAMTDDDMRVAPDWLDHLMKPFARNDVLAVTGNTLAASLETVAERDFEKYGGFSRGFSRIEFDSRWLYRGKMRAAPTWKIGGSGNVAFRASVFREPEIGPFVETLGAGVPAGVGEDTMIFYQILRSGGTIIYEPAAMAWHYHRVRSGELRRQIFAYSKGHIAYHLLTLRKYRDYRALTRVLVEVPLSIAARTWQRMRGRSSYPWNLLGTEMAGTLLGPWSLWCSRRHVRRLGPGPKPMIETRRFETEPCNTLETIQ